MKLNICKLLEQQNKSKYWLCQNMAITKRNLNNVINGRTSSISFKYIEDFCNFLNCTPSELMEIDIDDVS